jgi:hypothetical protein
LTLIISHKCHWAQSSNGARRLLQHGDAEIGADFTDIRRPGEGLRGAEEIDASGSSEAALDHRAARIGKLAA